MPVTRNSKSKVLDYEEVRSTRVNDENQNHDDDDDDEEEETPVKPRYSLDGTAFSNYDDYVEAKRKRNHAFLVSSGLLEAVARKKPKKRVLKPRVDAPQRRSSRLAGVESDGHYVLEEHGKGKVESTITIPIKPPKETFFQNRINDGSDLTIQEAIELNGDKWMEVDTVQRAERFVKEVLEPIPLFKRGRKESVVAGWESTMPAKIAALSVDDEKCVAKVTPQRTYCVAAHPSTDRILVCAGDKEGCVGVWDVDGPPPEEGASRNNNVHMFRLYHQSVPFVHWTKDNGILSASYDGSVRKLDVASGCFQEVFATYDGDSKYAEDLGYGIEEIAKNRNFWVQSYTPDHRHDPDLCFFLSTSVGTALHVDLRQGHRKVTFHETLSEKKLNTLSLHPNGYSLASAGNDGTLRIWDVRKFGDSSKRNVKSIAEFHIGKSINSAYFSPSGSTLVTTSFADTLDIIKDAHLTSGTIQPARRVPHDNATGRWLSTFMATWHPSLDIFVVGSMQHPRTMEIFDADGNLLRGVRGSALTSVVSRCCFHPSTDQLILIGSNSSGRVTVVR